MKKLIKHLFALSTSFFEDTDGNFVDDMYFQNEDVAIDFLLDLASNINQDTLDSEGDILTKMYCRINCITDLYYTAKVSLGNCIPVIKGNRLEFSCVKVEILDGNKLVIKRFNEDTARMIYPSFMKFSFEIYPKDCILISES